ncbi:MAG: signal peptide peptidase SppA [Cytophagales bacterium]|nr:signal peptide peptidase SppA [Cytophagales bacterium]
MLSFFRSLLATIIGLFLFTFIGFFLLIFIIGAASEDPVPEVKDQSVLALKLSGVLLERAYEDPFEDLLPGNTVSSHGLLEIIQSIASAKDDPKIEGIYLQPSFLSGGYASMQEIRDALIDFKSSGKFIMAYGEFMTEGDYYIASVADQLFLNSQGSIEFNGLSANVTFYQGMFEKLDIEPEIFRVGEYKSAIEPYIRKDLSKENEYQLSELLNNINDFYLNGVAESTDQTFEKVKEVQDQMMVQVPEDAEAYGLVSKIAYKDELLNLIVDELGVDEIDDINFISYKTYHKTVSSEYSRNKVAVIMTEGNIVMAGDPNTSIVGDKIAREIRKARDNDAIKAIVLRVNSPGGSITASDIIWHEVMEAKKVKPVIASMGTYAASGGYYISMPCDTIVAQPNTITGSIGIFSMLFNFGDFLENKLGITHDVVSTGEYSDLITVTRSMTPQERAIIQRGVDRGYETFISKAAEGRGLTKERIDELGGGRVWTGEQALAHDLVDVLGSFNDAIEIAASAAGISDDYSVRYYPEQKPYFEELIEKLGSDVRLKIFQPDYGMLQPYMKEIETLQELQGIQARMPMNLEIH